VVAGLAERREAGRPAASADTYGKDRGMRQAVARGKDEVLRNRREEVDDVAGASGRTDLLMTFFALLAALQYLSGRYTRSVVLFALAVAAKSSAAAPLPFAMWFLMWSLTPGAPPWKREWSRRLLPFSLLAIGGAFLQGMSRQLHGSVKAVAMPARLANMLAAYASYLGKAVWPANLSPSYPLRTVSFSSAAFAALLLLAVTVASVMRARLGNRALLLGWIWFLMMLGPFVGAFQAIDEAIADRYAYPNDRVEQHPGGHGTGAGSAHCADAGTEHDGGS
jgi:hypothetical protein